MKEIESVLDLDQNQFENLRQMLIDKALGPVIDNFSELFDIPKSDFTINFPYITFNVDGILIALEFVIGSKDEEFSLIPIVRAFDTRFLDRNWLVYQTNEFDEATGEPVMIYKGGKYEITSESLKLLSNSIKSLLSLQRGAFENYYQNAIFALKIRINKMVGICVASASIGVNFLPEDFDLLSRLLVITGVGALSKVILEKIYKLN
jgi:hypothetical protein